MEGSRGIGREDRMNRCGMKSPSLSFLIDGHHHHHRQKRERGRKRRKNGLNLLFFFLLHSSLPIAPGMKYSPNGRY